MSEFCLYSRHILLKRKKNECHVLSKGKGLRFIHAIAGGCGNTHIEEDNIVQTFTSFTFKIKADSLLHLHTKYCFMWYNYWIQCISSVFIHKPNIYNHILPLCLQTLFTNALVCIVL